VACWYPPRKCLIRQPCTDLVAVVPTRLDWSSAS